MSDWIPVINGWVRRSSVKRIFFTTENEVFLDTGDRSALYQAYDSQPEAFVAMQELTREL